MAQMIFNARCPVCNELLTWEQSGDTSWGTIPIDDQGCALVTIQDPTGKVNAHMAVHREDGTHIEVWKQTQIRKGEAVERMKERGYLS